MTCRFGAVISATTLATSICYPMDTVKRRLQVEGSPGYANSRQYNEFKYAAEMMKKEGVRSFYKGFGIALGIRALFGIINCTVYANIKRVKDRS